MRDGNAASKGGPPKTAQGFFGHGTLLFTAKGKRAFGQKRSAVAEVQMCRWQDCAEGCRLRQSSTGAT